MVVTQDRWLVRFKWTVHAPQKPNAHPNFDPVNVLGIRTNVAAVYREQRNCPFKQAPEKADQSPFHILIGNAFPAPLTIARNDVQE